MLKNQAAKFSADPWHSPAVPTRISGSDYERIKLTHHLHYLINGVFQVLSRHNLLKITHP